MLQMFEKGQGLTYFPTYKPPPVNTPHSPAGKPAFPLSTNTERGLQISSPSPLPPQISLAHLHGRYLLDNWKEKINNFFRIFGP